MFEKAGSLLFADMGFLGGMASVLDLGATLADYNLVETPTEADRQALLHDWTVVGADIRDAMTAYGT